jgi:predicted outer membrane repeat protein
MEKLPEDVLELSGIHDIRCIVPCTISGTGTHLEISGSDSQVRISNMRFTLSDSSAVRIETSSANATTTFCQTEFWRNTAHFGAAIFVARQSGLVNIVGSSFSNNEAVKGGAIYGGAKQLSIVDSVFVSNVAIKAVRYNSPVVVVGVR